MLVAINRTEKNKVASGEAFKRFNGSFDNVDISIQQLAAEVSQGYAFCAQHKKWRKRDNFVAAGFLAVDVDDGLRIEEALANEFIQWYGGLIYTSFSHTDENHRFRIVFELEQPITERQQMEHALTGLIRKLGGDASCKDACRLFFGNTNAQVTHIGNRLPASEVEQLVLRGQEIDLANSIPKPEAGSATVSSRQAIDPETEVRDSTGQLHRLVDLPPNIQIHCPVHIDNKPSAFTLRSKKGVPGIHCMTCKATFFVANDGPVYDFDYDLRVFREKPQEWLEAAFGSYPLTEEDQAALADGVCFVNQPFLAPVETDANVILVKSPKGTGKTEWLKRVVLNAKNTKKSVLLIGHRQALILSTAKRLGLTSYIDIAEDPHSGRSRVQTRAVEKHFAICLDSLSTRLKPVKHKFDIVIIDEVEQVLRHVISETIRPRRRQSLIYLQHYLQKAEQVYVLDADLNRVTGTALPALIGTDIQRQCLLLVNDWMPERGTTHLYQSQNHLRQVLREHIEAGKRCFVCSNSKTFIDSTTLALREQYPSKSFYAITSENSQNADSQEFLLSLPHSILKHDCVLVSPAVGTGVDITFYGGESKVDAVFGFFEPLITTHFEIDQQLCRVRHPGSVHVWVSPAIHRFETDPDVIRRELQSTPDESDNLYGLTPDGRPVYQQQPVDTLYAELYAEVTSLQRGSKNELRRNFEELRKLNGWQIVDVEINVEAGKQGRELGERGDELSAEQQARMICSAPEITVDKYRELKERSEHGTLLVVESAAMRRFEIESFYYIQATPALVELDNDGRYQYAIRRYEHIHDTEANIARIHRSERDLLFLDRRELIDRRRLLIELFTAAGVFTEGVGFDPNVIVTQQDLGRFIDVCRQQEVKIQRMLDMDLRSDLQEKAATQLGKFLKKVGLSLQKAGTKKIDDQKIYLYCVSGTALEAVQEIVNRRRSEHASWKADRTDNDNLENRVYLAIEAAVEEWRKRPRKPRVVRSARSQLADELIGD